LAVVRTPLQEKVRVEALAVVLVAAQEAVPVALEAVAAGSPRGRKGYGLCPSRCTLPLPHPAVQIAMCRPCSRTPRKSLQDAGTAADHYANQPES